ncbi:hypothetical protein RHSIM_Rhsim11G0112800 [Rhododendron simsii]|uniref:Uncharacterized protein n=1 Tax=Rhododendron simsii TaxID=118357 RepID=A0A834LCB4_RHOSS|nr:hypothetical protein RHSIM_Rhsim11G0112800 [Rhododendron simsii]
MEDDAAERSGFVIDLIENRAKDRLEQEQNDLIHVWGLDLARRICAEQVFAFGMEFMVIGFSIQQLSRQMASNTYRDGCFDCNYQSLLVIVSDYQRSHSEVRNPLSRMKVRERCLASFTFGTAPKSHNLLLENVKFLLFSSYGYNYDVYDCCFVVWPKLLNTRKKIDSSTEGIRVAKMREEQARKFLKVENEPHLLILMSSDLVDAVAVFWLFIKFYGML